MLFTSGSTGVPKGVAVTHANIVHYTRAVRRALGTTLDEPVDGRARQYALASTLAADLGNTSLFPALLSGATLHVLGSDVTTEPERYAQYMDVHQLDVLKLTPNHLRALVAGRSGAELAAVLPRQTIVLGGEALNVELARALVSAGTAARVEPLRADGNDRRRADARRDGCGVGRGARTRRADRAARATAGEHAGVRRRCVRARAAGGHSG